MNLQTLQRALFPALLPLSGLYAAALAARNAWYSHAHAAATRAGLPVISVGNITTGGTGKTPLVVEIVRRLRRAGEQPAILTRGYAARPGQTPDEVLEFAESLPDVPVVVDADRVRGAATAQREHDPTCLVLDDGFQHRRLARELDLVALDALDPWGGGWPLPAGRLREPLSGLRRADAFVITRCNQADAVAVRRICERLARYRPDALICRARVAPVRLVDAAGETGALDELHAEAVLPVCGIGNPRTFVSTVAELAGRCEPPLIFADHHAYAAADLRRITHQAERLGASAVVTTRKDWVKLAPLWRSATLDDALPLFRVDVRLVLDDPDGALDAALEAACKRGRA